MTRMIPPEIPADAPPGELALFDALAAAPGTDSWVALHSLRLARHPTQQRGEIDFVVIVPEGGIAVIEVKSHRTVRRDQAGLWHLGRATPTERSPFAQVDDAKFGLEGFLAAHMGLTLTHIESCVWFTHAPARRDLPTSIEWAPWQVLDTYQLKGDVAQAVRNVLSSGREHVAKAGRRWPPMVGPDAATAEKVVSLLRPALETRLRPSDQRRARDQELAELLDEQVDALDLVADNPRILITGPAGCGKTFLGLEAARRESATGKTGLLLCFNNALASQLSLDAAAIEGLRVHTLPGLMLEIAGVTAPEMEAPGQFWEDDIAQSAWDALVDDDQSSRADYLIVDEAQDLCRPTWLHVMDLLVDGGLALGRCLFLGDFNDQAIYSEGGKERLLERIPDLSQVRLRTNCRNVPEIAQAAGHLGSEHDTYGRVRRSPSGHIPQRHTFNSAEEQQKHLVEAVRSLREEGFELHEIVVLSRYRKSAAATCTDRWLAPLLVDARRGVPATKGRIRYSTIHSFKGLESPAVILTDLTPSSRGPYPDLLNIGMTRARDRLVMIGSRDVLHGRG